MRQLDQYCGHFIVLCKDAAGVKIIPDACAQRILYYKNSFDVFASQVKLIEHFFPLEDVVDPEAKAFFNSSVINIDYTQSQQNLETRNISFNGKFLSRCDCM